jgi:hypothetical protein
LIEAWLALLQIDCAQYRNGFAGVARRLGDVPENGEIDVAAAAALSDAVAEASCFYWKKPLCLQRSAALVLLLRRRHLRAKLTIGYRTSPFIAHAWVEVDGHVVNDSAQYPQRMSVLMTA